MKIYSREYFLRKILECTEEELLIAKGQKISVCSVSEIPKKEGVRRIISVQKGSQLLKLQKRLQTNFFSSIPLPPVAKGFIKENSYVDYLEEHIGHDFFMRLDIKDFFDSITEEHLRSDLNFFVEEDIINDIVELCTYNGSVPQGFVTSPTISNLVFRRLDQRIRKYCRSYYKERNREIFYTRYADDMLFSSVNYDFSTNKNFKRMIVHILNDYGFECNENKTIFTKEQITLSGYVVSRDVHLSRKKLHNINEVIYQFDSRNNYGNVPFKINEKNIDIKEILTNLNAKELKKANGRNVHFANAGSLAHYVAGYRSYLIQIARTDHGSTGYDKQLAKKIKKLETILNYLEKILMEL